MGNTYGLLSFLRDSARKVGLDVRPNTVRSRDDLRLVHFLSDFDISLLLDIGANRGQFASELFRAGYPGTIVSFEPIPIAHKALSAAAMRVGSRWIVPDAVALSDKEGLADFYVTATDTASSFYEATDELVASTPGTKQVEIITVETKTLDNLVEHLGVEVNYSDSGVFVKLDVQGAEMAVLKGAKNVLEIAKGVVTEFSLNTLYKGQPSSLEVTQVLAQSGFHVWDIWQGYRDPKTHRLEQVDIVWFRS